jgi:CRISPR-associated protein Csx17
VAELRLEGARSRPLVGYLKALGVLRVVARQADRDARGRWRDGAFELSARLDRDGLGRFLLEDYAPSPVVSPWNGGSGFFPKDRSEALIAIERSAHARLEPYREAIATARAVLRRRGLTDKPSPQAKPGLLRELRGALPDAALEWLDAAVALTGRELAYPPLLGSGGNDGRFDFSNNYASAVCDCITVGGPEAGRAAKRSAELLGAALDGAPARLTRLSLAHFQRDSSPVNSPSGESDALGNPWDLILALEGVLVMCAGAARRPAPPHGWELEPRLVAPFVAHPVKVGYGSAAAGEKAYAELWMPLWGDWAGLGEVELLVREARAQVGRRWARDGLDFVRAAAELGVARGIDAFERYPILERAGQARLAVPAGRIEVRERPAVEALRSLDPWLDQLRRVATGERAPRSLRLAAARLEEAMFEFAARGDARSALAVLVALGDTETRLARSARTAAKAGVQPVARVRAQPWLEAADDGSGEFAAAAALASLASKPERSPDMRDYLHGTRLDDRGRRVFDPDFSPPVARADDPFERLAAIHARQHLDACKNDARPGFDYGLAVDDSLSSAFALGRLDARRILEVACGLCVLDFRGARPRARPRLEGLPCPALDALALVWHANAADGLGPRPGWAAQLAAGAVSEVLREALIRLRLAGLAPIASAAELAAGSPSGKRLTAALLMRPSPAARARMARRLGATLTPHATDQEESG